MPSSGSGSGTPITPGVPGTPITAGGVIGIIDTGLPLDVWRNIIGYNPYHFWQQADNSIVPVTSNCNSIVYENAWLNADAAGREEIRRAIQTAEARLREHLNYSVGQRWIVETLQYPTPFRYGSQFAYPVSADGSWLNIKLSEGYIRNIGNETRAALDETAVVTYSDEDGDGLPETFTVSIAGVSATLDVEQVAVYFGASDRLDGDALSEKYRIRPIKVTLANTTLTIVGRSWLLVKPIKYQGFAKATIDPTDPATSTNYVDTVAVYRHHTDPTGITTDDAQATFIWETDPYPYWACSLPNLSFSPNETDPAAVAYAVGRVGIRDARLGEVSVGEAVWNADTSQFYSVSWATCRQPDRIIIRYEAGAKLAEIENTLNQSRINGRWDEIVARFAAAELSQRICGCDVANRELFRWQFDAALKGGGGGDMDITEADLANPFGTRAGQVYAWKNVKNLNTTYAFLP